MRNKPSQSQAVIDDQAHATPVVSNSKQMSRPAPSLPTAFLHQTNGKMLGRFKNVFRNTVNGITFVYYNIKINNETHFSKENFSYLKTSF